MVDRAVLFMTACINPGGMPETVLQDLNIRLDQYIRAVHYYLEETSFEILFVENSGYDISSHFEETVQSGRLEVITFFGNGFNHSLGKGFGECLVVKEALKRSRMLKNASSIIKVSGRHIVSNIVSIACMSKQLVSSDTFVVCDINKKTRGANSDLFIASKDFYERLVSNIDLINESNGRWFEHALYESIDQYVKDGNEFQYLPLPLNQEGQSGSMGIAFQKPTLKMYGMNMVKAVLYKLGILKVR